MIDFSNMKKNIFLLFFLLVVNWAGSYFFFRWDLTEERRFSLSEGSINLMNSLEKEVMITVYLSGDLNADFKRLEKTTRETLEELKVYAGDRLRYRFMDPTDITNEEKKKNLFIELAKKGVLPTNVLETSGGTKIERLVFPYALVSSPDGEIPVLLLKGNKAQSAQEQLNQSCENMEYQLATAIRSSVQTERKRIGFFPTYSSVPAMRQKDFWTSVYKQYDIFPIDLSASARLDSLDAIVVIKPERAFSTGDLFKIDQFIMGGGKAIFLLDATKIDSVGNGEGNFSRPNPINIENLLFKYGIRQNYNLVKDLECALIPLNVGRNGNQSQIQLIEWPYFPLLSRHSNSVITKNLDVVYSRFVGTLDTVRAVGIQKTPLLFTSPYVQVKEAPILLSYNDTRKNIDPKTFNAGEKVVAYLIEGQFNSFFQNQILSTDERSKQFLSKSSPTQIMVMADGDVALNDVDTKENLPLPLGFDRASGQTFGNKDFLLNTLAYMLDDVGVISARNKEILQRPLDKNELKENRFFWQLVNVLLPLILLVLFGFCFHFFRKQKYAIVR
jgi:ABC-2 type transport system permease protein